MRFAEKERHQIFVEPEGLDSIEFYPNGISTSLPVDVQSRYAENNPWIRAGQHTQTWLCD